MKNERSLALKEILYSLIIFAIGAYGCKKYWPASDWYNFGMALALVVLGIIWFSAAIYFLTYHED